MVQRAATAKLAGEVRGARTQFACIIFRAVAVVFYLGENGRHGRNKYEKLSVPAGDSSSVFPPLIKHLGYWTCLEQAAIESNRANPTLWRKLIIPVADPGLIYPYILLILNIKFRNRRRGWLMEFVFER